jgi:trehalose utilization protein
MEDGTIRVTVWNEFRHEKRDKMAAKVYPRGIHGEIASFLDRCEGIEVRIATLDEKQHGLTDDILESTDVMTWWGHVAHDEVRDEVAAKVEQRVLAGMGLIVLHSGHFSKPFRRLMGTGCSLKWREDGKMERVWNVAPGHPITEGIGEYFELPHTEMYGEHFDIPHPDKLIFISWFQGGEVFRSGCVFERGNGRIFYFKPGHETYPLYKDPNVQKVIENALYWAARR